MGSSNENSGYGPVLNPWDTTRVPGGSSGGSRRGGRRRARAVGDRHRHRRLDPPARGAVRDRRAEADVRLVSRYGMIAFASSLDQAGPFTRDVTDAALLLRPMAGTDPCDSTAARPARAGRAAAARATCDGMRLGVPDGAGRGRASSPACSQPSRRRSTRARELGGERRDVPLPHAAARARRLLRARPGRGVLQPRPLRRRPLRTAGRAPTTCSRCTRRRAHDGFGDEVKRRIMLGTYALSSRLLRRLLRPRAAGAHADRARTSTSPSRAFDFIVTPTSAGGRLRARREDRRPARDVPQRLLHRADVARRHPRASRCRAGSRDGLPVGFQLAGPAFSENALLDAAHALEQAIGFELRAGSRA